MRETLATKYRPTTFEEVVGQETIVKILKHQIDTGTYKNAYIFIGSQGVSKTTLARIFSSSIGGHILEIDAASNNSADSTRTLVDNIRNNTLIGTSRVIVIDECHAFSPQAWQVMLKTLEEPPTNVVFIFCTTDAHKIPKTIYSRCQTFNFQRIRPDLIVARLKYILDNEGVHTYTDDALQYIATLSNGGMRDAITYLDKCLSFSNNITMDSVQQALGRVPEQAFINLTSSLFEGKSDNVLALLNDLFYEGQDMKQFISDYTGYVLHLNELMVTEGEVPIKNIDKQFLIELLSTLVKLGSDIKYDPNPRFYISSTLLLFGEKYGN